MTAFLARLLAHRFAERFILIVILVNAVTLGLETVPEVMNRWGSALKVLDLTALSIFVLELPVAPAEARPAG